MTHRPPHPSTSTNRPLSEPIPGTVDRPDTQLVGPWWMEAEILLVADRKPGSTHKFFHDWRINVVAGPDQAVPGSVLLTIPIGDQALVDSGWQYWLQRQAPRPGFAALDTATFSWVARTEAPTPDVLATATAQARAWLVAAATAGAGTAGAGAPR